MEMNASVFRPSRIKNGKRVRQRIYCGQYRLPGQTKVTRLSLETTDREVAIARLKRIVRDRELEAEGLAPARSVTLAAQTAFDELLDQYLTDLRRRGKAEKYTGVLEYRLTRLAKECGWDQLRQVNATSFESWRARRSELSAKTSNDFLGAMRSFLGWLIEREMLTVDPLKVVKKVQQAGQVVRTRRALTGDELLRLLAASGTRMPLYLTAVTTGLRRAEIESLCWRDVQLEGKQPCLRLQAEHAKNRRTTTVPLRRDVAEVLARFRPAGGGDDEPVFPRMRRLETWKADLKAAGIPFTDGAGRRADFHALRHTFCSMLAKAGVPQRVAQEAMRHSDPKLTAMVYTDPAMLNTAAAVESLPITIPTAETAQPDQPYALPYALASGTGGLSVSPAVPATPAQADVQPIENGPVSREKSAPDARGQKDGDGSGGRARTYNLGVNSALLYH
jgi:integrase